MYIAAIAVIAAVILIYFSFFSGKSSDSLKPELVKEALEDIAAGATVKHKTVESSTGRRGSLLRYFAVFSLDNGGDIECSVSREVYDALNVGDRNTLVYHGGVFVGFGDIGAVADPAEASDSGAEAPPLDDGFTLEDYDESIDMEIPIGEESSGESDMSEEDREDYKLFTSREKLPVKTEAVSVEIESCADYPAESLLNKITVYPFLKRETEVRRMFVKTYSEALNDLLGYEGSSRSGRAANSVYLKKNEIRVVITIEEKPLPLLTRIEAEFGVNE